MEDLRIVMIRYVENVSKGITPRNNGLLSTRYEKEIVSACDSDCSIVAEGVSRI